MQEDSEVTALLKSLQKHVYYMFMCIINNLPTSVPYSKGNPHVTWNFLVDKQLNMRYMTDNFIRKIKECAVMCAENPRVYLPKFLTHIPQIAIDDQINSFPERSIFALLSHITIDTYMKEVLRYIAESVLAEFWVQFFQSIEQTANDKFRYGCRRMMIVLSAGADDECSVNLKQLFTAKWELIINLASKIGPMDLMTDMVGVMKAPFSQKPGFISFMLKVFSHMHFPHFNETVSKTLMELINLVQHAQDSYRSLLPFIRNLLGFALLEDETYLVPQLKKLITKIHMPDIRPANSALVLFHTIGNQTDELPPLLENISEYTMEDTLEAIMHIFNGRNWATSFDEVDYHNWCPREYDIELIPKLTQAIMRQDEKNFSENFSHCGVTLARFFMRAVVYDSEWFLEGYFNKYMKSRKWYMSNRVDVLVFMDSILATDKFSMILSGQRKGSTNEEQFMNLVKASYTEVINTYRHTTNATYGYTTNEIKEGDRIVEDVKIMPQVRKSGVDIKTYVTAWEKLTGSVFGDAVTSSGTPRFKRSFRIAYYETDITHAMSIFSILDPDTRLINKVVSFLLDTSPLVSAVALRALERYITINKTWCVLDAVQTLRPTKVEGWYQLVYSMFRIVKKTKESGVAIDEKQRVRCITLFTWIITVLCSSCPETRRIALKLSDLISEWFGDDNEIPNFSKFLAKNSQLIWKRAVSKMFNCIAVHEIKDYGSYVDFRSIVYCNAHLVYYFYWTALVELLPEYITDFPYTRELLIGQVSSLMYSYTWDTDAVLTINLATVHSCLSSEFTLPIVSDGLKAAESRGGFWIAAVFSAISKHYAMDKVIQLLSTDTPAHTRALVFSLRSRMETKNYDKEIDSFEIELRKVVEYLMSDEVKMFALDCNQQLNLDILEKDPEWVFVLNDILRCVRSYSELMYQRYVETDRKGTILRHDAVSRDFANPFQSKLWFAFMLSMTDVPQQYSDISKCAHEAYCAFVQVARIPDNWTFMIKARNDMPNILDSLAHTLSASFACFLPSFIHNATHLPSFFWAIANQFIEIGDIENHLGKLKKVLHNDKDHEVFRKHTGSLLSLGMFYITDSEAENRQTAFKLLYHLAIFAFVVSSQIPSNLIDFLDHIKTHYLTSAGPVPEDVLLKLNGLYSTHFSYAASEYVITFFAIVQKAEESSVFMRISKPWFAISKCVSSVMNQLVNATYQVQGITRSFTEFPLGSDVVPLIENLIGNNPKAALHFFLNNKKFSKSTCVFILRRYTDQVLSFSSQFLTFNHWLTSKSEDTKFIQRLLEVLLCVVRESEESLSEVIHIIYCYAFCYDYDDLVRAIHVQSFTQKQKNDLVEEAQRWAVSCGDVKVAIHGCKLLQRCAIERSTEYSDSLLNTITVVCKLLSESTLTDCSMYIDYLTHLLDLAYQFDPDNIRMKHFVCRLLTLNKYIFRRVFATALTVFKALFIEGKTNFESDLEAIFMNIITVDAADAETTMLIMETLFAFADSFGNQNLLFLTLLPHWRPEYMEKILKLGGFDTRPDDLPGAAASIMKEQTPEMQYIIIHFYMVLIQADTTYTDDVRRICNSVMKSFGTHSPVTISVFRPLVKILAELDNNREASESLYILGSFARSFVEMQTCEDTSNTAFPDLGFELELNSIPFVPKDAEFSETATLGVLDRAMCRVPTAETQRAELDEEAEADSGGFDYMDIVMKIDEYLNKRKMPRLEDIFSLQSVDRSIFAPSIAEVNAIGSTEFPPIKL